MKTKKMLNALRNAFETSNGSSFGIMLGRNVERLPLYSFRELVDAYNAVVRGDRHETIDAQVMRVCQHYGISCKADGIGWILG